jgi:hypothetical protein
MELVPSWSCSKAEISASSWFYYKGKCPQRFVSKDLNNVNYTEYQITMYYMLHTGCQEIRAGVFHPASLS